MELLHFNVKYLQSNYNKSIVKDHVWAVAEMFIDGTPDIEDFFMRTLDSVKSAADRFAKGMQGEQFEILRHLLRN